MAKLDKLGEFEQLALLAVLHLEESAYGASIQEELDRRGGRPTSISSIYITLTRMEQKGLVSSRMSPPKDGRAGKARRFFSVEPAGIEALRSSRARLIRMWDGLEDRLAVSKHE